ncbi:glycosyltransferase [Thalassotalea sp. PS06]|uniref:glycosyltransferase n=1 Tax=Thalassotalea sp. PS06 TaxID=2594005 RepID=UPI00163DCFE5|nr:glycosyltransferase [Thalassotalea sp. PS06]
MHSPTIRCGNSRIKNYLNVASEVFSGFFCDRVICVSSSIFDYAKPFFNSDKLIQVNNGVPEYKLNLSRNYSVTNNNFNICCVGLFRERKGILNLVKAIKKSNVNCNLNLVGRFVEESYRKEVLNECRSSNIQVNLLGFRDSVQEEMLKNDLFILPSLPGEGLPMVLLEAMSVGMPIICTNVEGVSETLQNNVSALIVEHSSIDSLSKAIIRMHDDELLRENLGMCSRNKFENEFSSTAMTKRVSSIYDEFHAA